MLKEEAGDTSGGIDIDAAVEQIGSDLFGSDGEVEETGDSGAATDEQTEVVEPVEETESEKPGAEVEPEKSGEEKQAAVAQGRPAPKSWARDKHQIWDKLPPEAQEQVELRERQILEGIEMYKDAATFGNGIREIVRPYEAYIQSRGVDVPTAIKFLMNADYKLMHAPMDERMRYFAELAQDYGVDLTKVQPVGEAAEIDPNIKSLKQQVDRLTSSLTERQTRELYETRERTTREVNAFADAVAEDGKTPKHPYFDEVADDIIRLINTGLSLEDAYEKAVWANPVTRQKELARVRTDDERKQKENARLAVLKAKKAASPNIRGRDTGGAPTESTGSMEDTLRETYREIQNRTR